MRKTLSSLFVSAIALYLTGCAHAVAPVTGFAYTDVKGPIHATEITTASKTGEATCKSILGLVAIGDCSIKAAKKNGGITTVSHIDYHTNGILGLYATFKTTVWGQ